VNRQATAKRMNLIGLLFGTGFGFVLAAARLTEYNTIHAMLKLDEPDVFLLMGSAIAVSMPLLWVLERRNVRTLYGGTLTLSRSKPQRHHYLGGVMFGTGWALAGTCPAPAIGMIATGALLGLPAVAGLCAGLMARDRHVQRAPADEDGEHNPAATPVAAGAAR